MQLELSVSATASADDMQVSVFIDNIQLLVCTCKISKQTVYYDIPESDVGTHRIKIIMSGKQPKHTIIDESGNILSDVMIKVDSIRLDDIDCSDIFCTGLKCYRHDGNGTQPEFIDEFYGLLGCNGTVSFEFTTPIHIWFLKQAT